MTPDIDLLVAELDVLWTRDGRGRLLSSPEPGKSVPVLVIATAADGHAIATSAALPGTLADELAGLIRRMPPSGDASQQTAPLDACVRHLVVSGYATSVESGPSYLIEPTTRFEPTARIVISSSGDAASLRDRAPIEANWTVDEWSDLLAGRLGPWAMALEGDRVVAICHSARLTDRGAEAGVWTHPEHRGRGHAATVTAAWAGLLHGTGRHLFYSTSAANRSSQQVAARLGLRPIGWLWKLMPA